MLRFVCDLAHRTVAPLRPAVASCEAATSSSAQSVSSDNSGSAGEVPESFTVFHVLGFPECPWFHRASCIAQDLERQPEFEPVVQSRSWPVKRSEYAQQLRELEELVPEVSAHNSCPAVLETQCHRDDSKPDGVACGKSTLVGGYADLEKLLQKKYGFTSTYCEQLKRMTGSGTGAC